MHLSLSLHLSFISPSHLSPSLHLLVAEWFNRDEEIREKRRRAKHRRQPQRGRQIQQRQHLKGKKKKRNINKGYIDKDKIQIFTDTTDKEKCKKGEVVVKTISKRFNIRSILQLKEKRNTDKRLKNKDYKERVLQMSFSILL